MPTALSTTKRKFHKLLDSLASNASSTSLPSHDNLPTTASSTTLPNTSTSDTLTPSKRPRVSARPLSAYIPRSAGMGPPSTTSAYSSRTTTTRPRSLAVVQTKPQYSASGENKGPPTFAPWDRDRFLDRLKTYRFVDKWRAKPEPISEVEWARRGWSCVGRETVGCVGGCGVEIVVLLEEDVGVGNGANGEDAKGDESGKGDEEEHDAGGRGGGGEEEEEGDDWRDKAQEQLVERYREMISSGHAEGCLWRRRGCDDVIQRLPLVHQANALEGLRTRYQSLAAMASELPEEIVTPDSLDVARVLQQAQAVLEIPTSPSSAESSPESPIKTPSSAFLLALFGWQAEENHVAGLATCNACFRRLGLWLFRSSDPSMNRLDVVIEHRDFCPWINPLSQNGGSRRSSLDGLAGWELCLRAIGAKAGKGPLSENANGTVGRADLENASVVGSVGEEDFEKAREERDKERWAKLKRLKQVFQVKRRPGTSGSTATVRSGRSELS